MKKYIAEFIGTFTLVFLGCGAAVIAGADIGVTGIALAFGLALISMAYGIGHISGCHINPAVSIAAVIAGRMSSKDLPGYVVAQVAGAMVASLLLMIVVGGIGNGLGQNGWGPGYGGEYGLAAAFIFEVVATFLFLITILGSTSDSNSKVAGLAIGLALVAIHIVGIKVTGVSVNPARSLAPAIFVGGQALQQVWLFIVAPVIGAVAAAMLFKTKTLE